MPKTKLTRAGVSTSSVMRLEDLDPAKRKEYHSILEDFDKQRE